MPKVELSKHFELSEFTKSEYGTINRIPCLVLHNLVHLCVSLLEPAHDFIDAPIFINSGYRTKLINQRVGGVPNSMHLQGRAADIRTVPSKMDILYSYLQNMPHTELIRYDNFIHVAL